MPDEMSGELGALVDAARAGDEPGARDRERVRGLLIARLGAGALVGGSVAAGSASASAAAATTSAIVPLGTSVLTKVLVASLLASAAVGLGVGVGALRARPSAHVVAPYHAIAAHTRPVSSATQPARGGVARSPATTSPAAVATAPRAVATAPRAVATSLPPAATSLPPAPSGLAPALRPARASAIVAPAGEDLASLQRARALLVAHHPADALLELEHFAAAHPASGFEPERRIERAIALCDLGRVDEGRHDIARAAREAPSHPALPTAREACGITAPAR